MLGSGDVIHTKGNVSICDYLNLRVEFVMAPKIQTSCTRNIINRLLACGCPYFNTLKLDAIKLTGQPLLSPFYSTGPLFYILITGSHAKPRR
jgi:hypothetical protein